MGLCLIEIVIGPGRTANTVYTIGGNVTNSVGRKTVKLNADGTLKPRNDGKPWICILRLIA